jgi:hypothetical protein
MAEHCPLGTKPRKKYPDPEEVARQINEEYYAEKREKELKKKREELLKKEKEKNEPQKPKKPKTPKKPRKPRKPKPSAAYQPEVGEWVDAWLKKYPPKKSKTKRKPRKPKKSNSVKQKQVKKPKVSKKTCKKQYAKDGFPKTAPLDAKQMRSAFRKLSRLKPGWDKPHAAELRSLNRLFLKAYGRMMSWNEYCHIVMKRNERIRNEYSRAHLPIP